jgi:hypothetical protein
MKAVFTILCLIPLFGLAQDCKLRKETDRFSQQPKITTGFMSLGSGMVSLTIDATAAEIDMMFKFRSAGQCFDDASTSEVLFDGTKAKAFYKNNGGMNCEGIYHINFRNTVSTPYGFKRLMTTKVNTIKIIGADKKPVEIVLTEEEKILLQKMATCMAEEAKTLQKK